MTRAWQVGRPKMQVAVEKLSPVLIELAIEIDSARVRTELDKAYGQLSKTARVRGFRQGKAPKKVLTHLYGSRIAADVSQRLVEECYEKALSEQKVQAVSQPAIEPGQVKEDEAFKFKARVEIVPEIEKVAYAGFKVTKPKTSATDEEVSKELESLRVANSTLEPLKKPRGVKEGDVVTIDFDIAVGGEIVDGAGAQNFDAEVGTGAVLPEVEAALLGKKNGDAAEAIVDLPAEHPHPQLKGQTATFSLTLRDIKERILPSLDDEFAKDLGDYETLAALRVAVKEDLDGKQAEQAENAVAEGLVRELVKANPIEVPPALVLQQDRMTEQEMVYAARAQGRNVSRLPDDVRAKIHADSEVKVRAGLLMAEIAKREGLKIGDAEIEEGLKELAEQTGKNVAKLRAEYRDAKRREMLIGMILENKVLDIVESKANIESEA